MMLVSYSDSEGSEDEKLSSTKPTAKSNPPQNNLAFAVDKSNPRKIRVNLADTQLPSSSIREQDVEPASKKPRIGGGAFSGFNAMLPPPKRDSQTNNTSAAATSRPARKVFSLKTGAEPGFSRESDAELRQLFSENDYTREWTDPFNPDPPSMTTFTASVPENTAEPVRKGNAMMFKPLSIARNPQKKKKPTSDLTNSTLVERTPSQPSISTPKQPSAAKVSLFSSGIEAKQPTISHSEADFDEDFADESMRNNSTEFDTFDAPPHKATSLAPDQPAQSLETIASDLNLSAAARRQLFGRNGKPAGSAINVVNFNTDAEYAANEVIRASGEQVQHNPVRAIAPGKHSLKQLVSAASGQKEALEESFAAGKRNKKEAGSRYGW